MATWVTVYRALNSGKAVKAVEASRGPRGHWTVRQPGQRLPFDRYKPAAFEKRYGATPLEAVDKKLAFFREQLETVAAGGWGWPPAEAKAAIACLERLRAELTQTTH